MPGPKAIAKLSSEERCKKAFESWRDLLGSVLDNSEVAASEWAAAYIGWEACWRFLQAKARKEFIEV